MNTITKHIPNFLTCCNIFCGTLAIVYPIWGLHFILLGAIFDFFDGFAARWLKSFSPIGKDLDSLADMLTFGAAPAVMMFQIDIYFALLLPIFSALRLAKFNIDTRQSNSFLGLPTPANGIFWVSIAYFFNENSFIFIWHFGFLNPQIILNALVCLFCYFMISEIRMFSFKIKSLSFKNIVFHLLFLVLILLFVFIFLSLEINILFSLPIIIIIYVFLSLIKHFVEPYEVYS